MDELLQAIKSYLRITWDDDDSLIMGYISRGKSRLNRIAGAELDYTAEGLPRSLLFDYVRYANSQALEAFERNYERELLALHLDTQADLLEETEVDDNED